MLPRTSGLLVFCVALSATSAGFLCHAQPAQPSQPVRYHFGDDPDGKFGWAAPSFDDSTWPVAQAFGQDDDITVLTLQRQIPATSPPAPLLAI
jgi:hypothetical protein